MELKIHFQSSDNTITVECDKVTKVIDKITDSEIIYKLCPKGVKDDVDSLCVLLNKCKMNKDILTVENITGVITNVISASYGYVEMTIHVPRN